MPSFLTRIELHAASPQDYAKLHEHMARLGFLTTINGQDGQVYTMPTAEYSSHHDLTAEQVRDLARSAAYSTSRSFWVITVEYTSAAWLLAKSV